MPRAMHEVARVEAMCFDARDAVARVHAGLRELGVLGTVVPHPFDADTGIVTAHVATRRGGDPLVLVDGVVDTLDAQELAERLRMRCAASVLVVRGGERIGLSSMEAAIDRIRDDPRTCRRWVVLPTRALDDVSSLPEAARVLDADVVHAVVDGTEVVVARAGAAQWSPGHRPAIALSAAEHGLEVQFLPGAAGEAWQRGAVRTLGPIMGLGWQASALRIRPDPLPDEARLAQEATCSALVIDEVGEDVLRAVTRELGRPEAASTLLRRAAEPWSPELEAELLRALAIDERIVAIARGEVDASLLPGARTYALPGPQSYFRGSLVDRTTARPGTARIAGIVAQLLASIAGIGAGAWTWMLVADDVLGTIAIFPAMVAVAVGGIWAMKCARDLLRALRLRRALDRADAEASATRQP